MDPEHGEKIAQKVHHACMVFACHVDGKTVIAASDVKFVLASLGMAPDLNEVDELVEELVDVGEGVDEGESAAVGDESTAVDGGETGKAAGTDGNGDREAAAAADGEAAGGGAARFVALVALEEVCIRAVVDNKYALPSSSELQDAFTALVARGRSYLTAEEFKTAMVTAREEAGERPLDEAELSAALSAAVNPSNGRIEIADYAAMLLDVAHLKA
ncbi:uncharacterized protein AMSG_00363 [Thecamonas trahens ATCC 50062]|uniref:EF-hand domain-containing protein n=1 Tax=Thecamonas trahens ATCC 50062 TaxID=461836 RepID=A0A0L0D969_THETB|nr:hypothetical protein AMSG_00363 [Thecamonas trahens ATCC 50062]KNC48586.1 hypothetical protein AMSG_00363 [Thecamonas trahens ATCC 50062]|eukprot:XP_013762642.1 hypothetical protein AMSG_00363 [Thecamonas trahens ATCC 50062]